MGFRCLRLGWLATLLVFLCVPSASGEIRRQGAKQVEERLSGIRIPFIANSGQTDPAVAYYAQTFAGTVFVTRDGRIVYSLPGEKDPASAARSSGRRGAWSLIERPVGGSAQPSGSDPSSTGVSYFLGDDPTRWGSGLATFEAVSLGEVWPGICLDLRARGKNVEKFFTVEPGGDPSRIRMSVEGARSLRVNKAGALVVGTGPGEVTFTPPVAFQERQGTRRLVKAAYELYGRGYGFRLGDYDPTVRSRLIPCCRPRTWAAAASTRPSPWRSTRPRVTCTWPGSRLPRIFPARRAGRRRPTAAAMTPSSRG